MLPIYPNWNASTEWLVAPFPAASRSPTLLLSDASVPLLSVTLTHFTLLSYGRALRLPTSFSISGFARHGVKPRLCRSSWSDFASTHPLMLPSTSPKEVFLACSPSPPWNLSSYTVESTLSSICSCYDLPPSCQGAALAQLDSLPSHNLVLWTNGSVPFPFGKGSSFSFWRTCQLLPQLHCDPSFLFSRFSILKFFHENLCQSVGSLLVSAAPTSLPLLIFSPPI